GCCMLLDLNNICVSARNHGFDPGAYLEGIPPHKVWQFHLAGHSDKGAYLLDTHDHPVIDPVWELYREAVLRFGQVSTLIEWDDRIPAFERLEQESQRARAIHDEALPSLAGPAGGRAARHLCQHVLLPAARLPGGGLPEIAGGRRAGAVSQPGDRLSAASPVGAPVVALSRAAPAAVHRDAPPARSVPASGRSVRAAVG